MAKKNKGTEVLESIVSEIETPLVNTEVPFEEITPIDENVVELIEVRRQLNLKPNQTQRSILLARQTVLQGKI